ncbi:MAG: GTA-gp10 family protein [Pseudomonadota bacterium]
MNECARELEFAGGRYVFCLNDPKVLAVLNGTGPRCARVRSGVLTLDPLRGANGDTPAACLRRFEDGAYSLPDIERILLYGLWGGGMSLSDANGLITEHVRGKPIASNAALAFEVLAALFIGAADAGASA